ncbi:hypothetical protein N2152v2_006415 [Parachlorella kessleri]
MASTHGLPVGNEAPTLQAPSIDLGPDGTLKIFKSFQAYEFNHGGMSRSSTSPLAAGAAALQQYKIAESDVKVIRTVGQGASALVQKAFLPRESRFAAVKKISVLEREKRHQLMNDIKALCHAPNVPGLIRFYGAFHAADKGQIAVVLEYMDGGSLADVLAKVKRIPEDVLAAIAAKVLPALAFLHSRHMVHRDLKPANILMSTTGEPKLADFGISAFMDNTIAQCHTFLGTVTYMSPERINGEAYSFPADVWALGLTLLECATGRYPYDASGGTMQLMIQLMQEEVPIDEAQLSPELVDFVRRSMHRDPWQRPSAEGLQRHPFIRKYMPGQGQQPVDLRSFMRVMHSPNEQLEDAVRIMTSRYYNNLSYNYRDSDSIASYYAAEAHLSYNGERLKGRYTIAKHFHTLLRQVAAAGDIAFVVDALDFQQLEGAADTLLVQTRVDVVNRAVGPDEGGPEVLGTLADCFTLRLGALDLLQPGAGSFLILLHMSRWLQPLQVKKHSKLSAQKCRVQ